MYVCKKETKMNISANFESMLEAQSSMTAFKCELENLVTLYELDFDAAKATTSRSF